MKIRDILPDDDDPQVLSFCGRICPGGVPFYVPVQPWSQSKMLECFDNVARKTKTGGGRAVYGWSISAYPKIHLEAQFHAIWQSPAGKFVDVTSEEVGMRTILFLRDDTRTYIGTRVPHLRFALGDEQLVERYWNLSDESQAIARQLIDDGHMPGEPIFRERLGAIVFEIDQIKSKLCAT